MEKVRNITRQETLYGDPADKISREEIKRYHEEINIPFEETCSHSRPPITIDMNMANGEGGLNTILGLIYHALTLQEEHINAELDNKKKVRRGTVVKKDITDILEYEKDNTEYFDVN